MVLACLLAIFKPSVFHLVCLSLTLALFEDLLRKSFGLPIAITLGKDVAIILAFARIPARDRLRYLPSKFRVVAVSTSAIFLLLATGQVLAGIVPLSVALVGLRSYLYFLPCVAVASYLAVKEPGSIVRLLKIGVVSISIAGWAAAGAQLHLVPAGLTLSPLPSDLALHEHSFLPGVDNIALAPSIFGLADRLARHCLTGLVIFVSAVCWRAERLRPASLLIAFGLVIGIAASGRRTAWALTVLALAMFPLLSHHKRIGRALRGGTGVVALLAVLFLLGGSNWLSFAKSTVEETARLPDIFSLRLSGGVSGVGIGRASQGVVAVSGGYYATSSAETGLAKLTHEAGLLGLFVYGFFLAFTGRQLLRYQRLRPGSLATGIAILFLCLLAWFLKGAQILGDSQTLLHLWLLVGIVLARVPNGHEREGRDYWGELRRYAPK